MAIVKTEILKIGQFLQNTQLNIPTFQRPYKWSVKNVVQLLDDIQRFKDKSEYRIGTIVVHRDPKGLYQIVDGQQRSITFLLILKAILNSPSAELQSAEIQAALGNLRANCFSPKFASSISKKNIQTNYREINRRVPGLGPEFIDVFLNRCTITHFVIDDISEAFQFFDSQNARGRDLEPHDLLKAFHLREMDVSVAKEFEKEKVALVETWENMGTDELANLFANFLYRVKGWSKGDSSRYFSKNEVSHFKGITLKTPGPSYPHSKIYQIVDKHLRLGASERPTETFPFQLDQVVLNGEYFFKMISHYKAMYDSIGTKLPDTFGSAARILNTLDTYSGRNRIGDRYVRMLFNCALLHYIDRFGNSDLNLAVEKIFIWAYTLRLSYQTLQLASVDNYVVQESNIFKKIKQAINKEDILALDLPLLEREHESDKTKAIKKLFIELKYHVDRA